MEISIGDKVRFLNDIGGGIVVKLLPKNMVLVKDLDEFEYPFPAKEIVVVEKAKPKAVIPDNQKTQIKHDEKSNIEYVEDLPILKDDNTTEIILAFIRKTDGEFDGFETYLVNDSNYYLFYHVVLRGEKGYQMVDAEILEPNTKICVGDLSRMQINTSKEIIIQLLFYGHPHQKYHELSERSVKIVPLKFFQEHSFKENDFFDDKAYVFELIKEKHGLGQSIKTQEDFENSILLKDNEEEEDLSKRYKPRKEALVVEVDLHINQLVDSVIGMSNADIIKTQMDVFHKTITDAILNKASKVIVIHGIGNGTLKAAIRESLNNQYKLKFEDASFREYGFGATEVIM